MNIKSGQKFGQLITIDFVKKNKWGQVYWMFRCSCGQMQIKRAGPVVNGDVKSCGCLRKKSWRKKW